MSIAQSIVRRPLYILAGLLLVVAACAPDSTGSPTESQPSFAAGDRPVRLGSVRTIDDEFSDLVGEVPGFGGLFYDESGVLTVYLKDPARLNQSRAPLQAFLARGAAGNVSRLGQIAGDVSRMRVLPATWDFRELRVWYMTHVIPNAGAADGVTMTDIDDRRNRIVIGVQDAGLIPNMLARMRDLGVPAGAVEVVEFGGHRYDPALAIQSAPSCDPETALEPCPDEGGEGAPLSLTTKWRPAPGGVQVEYVDGFSAFNCTLGFNIVRVLTSGETDPDRYFVTNSHCTDGFGVMTQMPMGQSTLADVIGREFADPALFTGAVDPACPAGRLCRYSDAALFIHDNPTSASNGRVAFPPVGSTLADETRVVVGTGDPIVGMAVHKVGRTTGHTTGTVTEVCGNFTQLQDNMDTGRTMLCQSRGSYSSSGGDSGSPVFEVWPDGTLVARGLHWSKAGAFSPLNEVLRELREVTGGGLGPEAQ